jgi:hypothetical protein
MSSAFGTCLKIDNVPTNAFAIILNPIRAGWAVCLTDGRELARFRGPGARFRALRYLHAQLRPGRRTFRR